MLAMQEEPLDMEDKPLIPRVHALVDLVDYSEWCSSKTLQRQEVENGGDSSLTTGLAMRVENTKLFALSVGVCQLIFLGRYAGLTYLNLTLIWIFHCSKSSCLSTPTSPAHWIWEKFSANASEI